MIETVDRALSELLRRDVLGDAVAVSLEAPNRPWTQGVTEPTVNLFLFDVRENLSRREVMLEPVRDASGAVVARRPPPARYDLFYILSVWGCSTEVEHQVLSAVVASLGSYDLIPPAVLGGTDEPSHGCLLSTAGGMKRGMLPTFGGEMKVQLELSVTVPIALPSAAVAGPPVREAAHISVSSRSPEDIAEARRRRGVLPAPRVPDADPFVATRASLAAAVAVMPPPPKPPSPPQPPGGRPPGARPPGAPGAGPGQQGAPAGARPPGAPAASAPAAGNPLAALRVALGQAAQAQASLAQAVAGLATLLPAPTKPPPPPTPADAPAAATPAAAPNAQPPATQPVTG